MTDCTLPPDLSTLDGRRGSIRIELSDDSSSYRCVRVFGAPPARIFRAFTDSADLRVWFPLGAPPARRTRLRVRSRRGRPLSLPHGAPEHGPMAWLGDDAPTGPPTAQTLTVETTGAGLTVMTMEVDMPGPEDPETFMEQSAAGLGSSGAAMDEPVST